MGFRFYWSGNMFDRGKTQKNLDHSTDGTLKSNINQIKLASKFNQLCFTIFHPDEIIESKKGQKFIKVLNQ